VVEKNLRSRGDRHLLGDGPHEGGELAGDGRDDDVGMLASGGEATEAFAETDLSLPSDVLDGRGETLEALADVRGDFGGIAVGPGAFDERATGMAIARFGDGSLAAGGKGRRRS